MRGQPYSTPSYTLFPSAALFRATDYFVKPVCMDGLVDILSRVAADRGGTTNDGPFQEPGRFGKLLGQSESMEQLYVQLARVAATDVTTLLIGESGTDRKSPRLNSSH